DEMRRLQRALGKEDPVIGEDADGVAADPGKAANEGLAVELFELVEFAAVDDSGDDFAHVVRAANVGRDDAVELLSRVERLARRGGDDGRRLGMVEIADDRPSNAEGVAVVECQMI